MRMKAYFYPSERDQAVGDVFKRIEGFPGVICKEE